MSEKLLPCPFCGEEPKKDYATLSEVWTIHCNHEDCDVGCEVSDRNEHAVIEVWNTRRALAPSSLEPHAVREALQLGLDAVMQTFEHVETNDDLLLAQMRHEAISAALATPSRSAANIEKDPRDQKLELVEGGLLLMLDAVKAGDPAREIDWRIEEELRVLRAAPTTSTSDGEVRPSTATSAAPVADFARDLAAKQEPLGAEFSKVLHDNLPDLCLKSDATPPSVGNADMVREALTDAETWCAIQARNIGNVDGYDYRSGEEAAYRHAAIELGKRAKLAALRAPVDEAKSKEHNEHDLNV